MWQRLSEAIERAWRPAATPHRVHVDDALAAQSLSLAVARHLACRRPSPERVTIVCIGTDRSTGDALGPLVGARLMETLQAADVDVLGTLDEPVHAANLCEVLRRLEQAPDAARRTIVAVDACLGKSESVGCITVKPGPLHPGAGVHKSLPPVGHFHIMGVVNVGGFMEYFVLQNTRLSLVMRMARVIADGLRLGVAQWRTLREAAATLPENR
ncbi:MAG: spore protease YyaC [Limnochordales bacterium]|nr:spore protease YyaC [Bacillota bacterium]